MQVETVLNRVHKVKGFVYEQVRFVRDVIEVDVRAICLAQNQCAERRTKVRLRIRKAYGYRTLEVAETDVYHALANLPEPKLAHEFC